MTDQSDERKALEFLVALIEKHRWTCVWKNSEDEPAVERAKAVLATAPAEPPIEDAEIAMLRRIYITNPMPGWFAAPENAAANIRMLLERLSAPPSGEVAALIERHRKLHKVLQENGSLTFHWYSSETASGENDWTFKETADALARLSAPVPDNAAAIYEQCAKIAFDTPDKFGTLANDSHKECALVASRLINYAAKRAAPVPAREWIPVGERLPSSDADVLVAVGRNVELAYLHSDGRWKLHAVGAPASITHWMPLPPPPAADK